MCAGDGEFDRPFAIAIDANDEIYVVEPLRNRVQKFTIDGEFLTGWGSSGTGDGEFDRPFGIAIDATGAIFLADPGNQRIQVFR